MLGIFWEHTWNGLSLGAIYSLVALGYSLAFGVLRLINFAHADLYMMSAFSAYYLDRWLKLSQWGFWGLAILAGLTILSGGLLAVLMEYLAYRPLRQAPRINVLITAIGVSLFLQYLAQLLFGADPKFFQLTLTPKTFHVWGWSFELYDLLIFAVTGMTLFLLYVWVFRTGFGRAMRALSFNTDYARVFGLPVQKTISWTFFVGGGLAAVAALLIPLKYPKIDPLMGLNMGLKAFVAAVLGGIGQMHGAVLGALFLGVIEQWVAAYVSSSFRDAVAFFILIIVLLVKPEGLFGRKTLEKV
jgi:branched-chain amino acid transport system permease protein